MTHGDIIERHGKQWRCVGITTDNREQHVFSPVGDHSVRADQLYIASERLG